MITGATGAAVVVHFLRDDSGVPGRRCCTSLTRGMALYEGRPMQAVISWNRIATLWEGVRRQPCCGGLPGQSSSETYGLCLAAHRQPRDTGAPGASVKQLTVRDSVKGVRWRLRRKLLLAAPWTKPAQNSHWQSPTACPKDRDEAPQEQFRRRIVDTEKSVLRAVSGSPRTHNAFPFPKSSPCEGHSADSGPRIDRPTRYQCCPHSVLRCVLQS